MSGSDLADSMIDSIVVKKDMDAAAKQDKVPKIFLRIAEVVVKPIFEEDEPYSVHLRKMGVLTTGMLAAICVFLLPWIVVCISVLPGGANSNRVTMLIVYIGAPFQLFILPYLFMRYSKKCPVWIADLAVLSGSMYCLFMTTMYAEIDVGKVVIALMIATNFLSSPRQILIQLFNLLIIAFHVLRTTFRDSIPALQFHFDTGSRTLSEKMVLSLSSNIVALIGVAAVAVIAWKYIESNEEARVTLNIMKQVSVQLQRYDTNAISTILAENGESISADLLYSLSCIQKNLALFRPHIPQYLIDAAIEEAEKAEKEKEEQTTGKSKDTDSEGSLEISGPHGKSPEVSVKVTSVNETSQENSLNKSEISAAGASGTRRSGTNLPSAITNAQNQFYNGVFTTAYIDILHEMRSQQQSFSLLGGNGTGSTNAMANLSEGVSVVRIAFDISDFVEACNHISSGTKASLHHVEGDAMFVTWNATHRIGSHEQKAATFSLQLREAMAEMGISVPHSMSIVSGSGAAFFAGTTKSFFAVAAPKHTEQHRLLRPRANEYQATVMNQKCADVASLTCRVCAFDCHAKSKAVLSEPNSNANNSPAEVLFELISRKEMTDDEWMYQLEEAKDNDPFEMMNSAVVAFVEGDITKAQNISAKLPPIVKDRPILQPFLKRL